MVGALEEDEGQAEPTQLFATASQQVIKTTEQRNRMPKSNNKNASFWMPGRSRKHAEIYPKRAPK